MIKDLPSFFLLVALFCSYIGSIFPQTDIWEPTGGPSGQSIHALATNNAGTLFAGSWVAYGQIFRSTDNGDHWQQVTNWPAQHSVWSLLVTPAQEIFASTNGGAGIYISTDNGDTWLPASSGLTTNSVNAIAINDSGYLFAATDSGMFRSTDRGENWVEINTGLPSPYAQIVLTVDVDSNNYVFIGTFGNGIFRSTNNGDSWEEKNNGVTQLFINSIRVHPDGSLFAAPETGSGVYRSTDSGESWQFFATGLPVWENTYVLTIAPNGHILAGLSDGGVFISYDNGESWSDYSSGFTSSHVYALTTNHLGYAFAGVGTAGVFRTINPITGINGENPVTGVKNFELYQNFPNPFNPETQITFRIPQWSTSDFPKETGGLVELVVFDLLGREVKTLLRGNVAAGYYSVSWNGTDHTGKAVQSGIYLYRLVVGNRYRATKKMVLLR